ncbi:MAG: flagellar hook-length control protein FliK [Burkholderiaceae bacterium]
MPSTHVSQNSGLAALLFANNSTGPAKAKLPSGPDSLFAGKLMKLNATSTSGDISDPIAAETDEGPVTLTAAELVSAQTIDVRQDLMRHQSRAAKTSEQLVSTTKTAWMVAKNATKVAESSLAKAHHMHASTRRTPVPEGQLTSASVGNLASSVDPATQVTPTAASAGQTSTGLSKTTPHLSTAAGSGQASLNLVSASSAKLPADGPGRAQVAGASGNASASTAGSGAALDLTQGSTQAADAALVGDNSGGNSNRLSNPEQALSADRRAIASALQSTSTNPQTVAVGPGQPGALTHRFGAGKPATAGIINLSESTNAADASTDLQHQPERLAKTDPRMQATSAAHSGQKFANNSASNQPSAALGASTTPQIPAAIGDFNTIQPTGAPPVMQTTAAPGATATHAADQTPAPDQVYSEFIDAPLGTAEFFDQLHERVLIMARGLGGQASIRISPDDLGPIQVDLSMDGQQANLKIAAAHAETRAVLEATLEDLRDLFSQEGLELRDVHVDSQQHEREHTRQEHQTSARDQRAAQSPPEDRPQPVRPSPEVTEEPTLPNRPSTAGGVDLIA